MVLVVLVSAIRQAKEIKRHQIRNKKVKLSLFADKICVWNLQKPLKLINRCKNVNIQQKFRARRHPTAPSAILIQEHLKPESSSWVSGKFSFLEPILYLCYSVLDLDSQTDGFIWAGLLSLSRSEISDSFLTPWELSSVKPS